MKQQINMNYADPGGTIDRVVRIAVTEDRPVVVQKPPLLIDEKLVHEADGSFIAGLHRRATRERDGFDRLIDRLEAENVPVRIVAPRLPGEDDLENPLNWWGVDEYLTLARLLVAAGVSEVVSITLRTIGRLTGVRAVRRLARTTHRGLVSEEDLERLIGHDPLSEDIATQLEEASIEVTETTGNSPLVVTTVDVRL